MKKARHSDGPVHKKMTAFRDQTKQRPTNTPR